MRTQYNKWVERLWRDVCPQSRQRRSTQSPTLLLALLMGLVVPNLLSAQNPIVPNQGLNDPHVHIFNDTAYVYASHDKSADNKKFTMEDWWVWSSPDLVNWTKRSVLQPEDTYIGDPDFDRCWATGVGHRDGRYYWYFSEGNQQAGVGWHPANTGVIPAEEYFAVQGMRKEQDVETGFRMVMTEGIWKLGFPKITGLDGQQTMSLKVGSTSGGDFRTDVYRTAPDGSLVGSTDFTLNPLEKGYAFVAVQLSGLENIEDLYFEFHRLGNEDLRFDGFSFR